ncbi:metalloregulator ArsR/SmtB family transcription factor [Patescibacteria group bacterium]|nr:metalloregulator ArsR/SmtB family transcription factor [Patescibacteria group bacterium]MCL5797237.1 metalloregulator ArsR/SmtB family transcription factor [Patescibacteria group bacterium]
MRHLVISAICNPVRLKLIRCLSARSKNVQDLVRNCGLSQSAVSQHLLKLKKSGLVKSEKEGKFIYYSLTNQKAAKIAEMIQNFSVKAPTT